jgi:hypothetical protein
MQHGTLIPDDHGWLVVHLVFLLAFRRLLAGSSHPFSHFRAKFWLLLVFRPACIVPPLDTQIA